MSETSLLSERSQILMFLLAEDTIIFWWLFTQRTGLLWAYIVPTHYHLYRLKSRRVWKIGVSQLDCYPYTSSWKVTCFLALALWRCSVIALSSSIMFELVWIFAWYEFGVGPGSFLCSLMLVKLGWFILFYYYLLARPTNRSLLKTDRMLWYFPVTTSHFLLHVSLSASNLLFFLVISSIFFSYIFLYLSVILWPVCIDMLPIRLASASLLFYSYDSS